MIQEYVYGLENEFAIILICKTVGHSNKSLQFCRTQIMDMNIKISCFPSN